MGIKNLKIDRHELTEALYQACAWLVDVAQVKTECLAGENNSRRLQHDKWLGALRGEYRVATGEWDFFCPIWHSGQAIKALVLAHQVLGEPRFLQAAELAAGFIGSQRALPGSEDDGLIYGYEDLGDSVNTSAILVCLDGLMHLADFAGSAPYWAWITTALAWVERKAYLPGEGLFLDNYVVAEKQYKEPPWANRRAVSYPGRPLLENGVFLSGYKKTGRESWRRIFYATADRLLAEEEPAGNWIRFTPCNKVTGSIHPRQGYWWGLPMLYAYHDSGEVKYLECAKRVGEWYKSAQRRDGGLFRGTYIDFTTDSFGHATSGIACAALLWLELWRTTADDRWLQPLGLAIRHCMKMQFRHPRDANLKGAILEKVLPPDGTDGSPYYIRDLGTIFFSQVAARILSLDLAV